MNPNFDFYFAAEHCPKSAINYLKDEFRRMPYTEALEKNRDKIEFLCPIAKRYYGKSRAQLMRIFIQTSEYYDMYNA